LGGKKALFAGSDEGGDDWAANATLMENCKFTVINPHTLLTVTLTSLADGLVVLHLAPSKYAEQNRAKENHNKEVDFPPISAPGGFVLNLEAFSDPRPQAVDDAFPRHATSPIEYTLL
jgi:hypothetical protein